MEQQKSLNNIYKFVILLFSLLSDADSDSDNNNSLADPDCVPGHEESECK